MSCLKILLYPELLTFLHFTEMVQFDPWLCYHSFLLRFLFFLFFFIIIMSFFCWNTSLNICMTTMTELIHTLVTNYYQKLKRASEGIAGADGAGRTVDGACDLHRPIWIKSWQRLSPGARLCHKEPRCLTTSVTRSPTLSKGAPLFDNLCHQEPDRLREGARLKNKHQKLQKMVSVQQIFAMKMIIKFLKKT